MAECVYICLKMSHTHKHKARKKKRVGKRELMVHGVRLFHCDIHKYRRQQSQATTTTECTQHWKILAAFFSSIHPVEQSQRKYIYIYEKELLWGHKTTSATAATMPHRWQYINTSREQRARASLQYRSVSHHSCMSTTETTIAMERDREYNILHLFALWKRFDWVFFGRLMFLSLIIQNKASVLFRTAAADTVLYNMHLFSLQQSSLVILDWVFFKYLFIFYCWSKLCSTYPIGNAILNGLNSVFNHLFNVAIKVFMRFCRSANASTK